MDAVKIPILLVLLLGVFSLPTMTAAQLVGVLGVSTELKSLEKVVIGDSYTYIKISGDDLTVSYTRPGPRPIIRITNPNPVRKLLRLAVHPSRDSALLSQTVRLTARSNQFVLHDHSILPFNPSYDITLLPQESVDLVLETFSDPGATSYGTISLSLKEF